MLFSINFILYVIQICLDNINLGKELKNEETVELLKKRIESLDFEKINFDNNELELLGDLHSTKILSSLDSANSNHDIKGNSQSISNNSFENFIVGIVIGICIITVIIIYKQSFGQKEITKNKKKNK